jgi:hypothetical protein
MKFFRRTARYTIFSLKRNVEILQELKVEQVDLKLRTYKPIWLRHLTGINSSRMAKIVLNCRPNGRRGLGSSLNELLDEAETGLSRPKW